MGRPILNQLFAGLVLDHSSKRAVYLQLADVLLSMIKKGKLHCAQQLPPTRDLAVSLHLNRITVSRAYEELQLQGWLESFVGRGTFVAAHLPVHPVKAGRTAAAAKPSLKAGFDIAKMDYLDEKITIVDKPLHLDDGFPDVKLAPLKELYRAYRSQLTRGGLYQKFGAYGLPDGSRYYREALSGYLNDTRAMKTTAANILSVNGTVMGLNLVCNGLLKSGDIVISGVPGWGRAEKNFAHAGAKQIGVRVDEHGMVVDDLKKICKKRKVRMVYVTPHHNYPTTVSLRIDRRLELLRLASEYGFIILEDDYDFDFHYARKPLQPLAGSDGEGMVIYCGSFSKSFSPAFRMGYLVAPENVIGHLSRVRMLIDRQGDHILDNAMGELLNDGTIQRYLRKALAVYKERRDVFCDLLRNELSGVAAFSIPEGGMSVWTRFDKSINLEKLSLSAYKKGLFIGNGKAFIYPGFNENALRLGFASSSTQELGECTGIIKRILSGK